MHTHRHTHAQKFIHAYRDTHTHRHTCGKSLKNPLPDPNKSCVGMQRILSARLHAVYLSVCLSVHFSMIVNVFCLLPVCMYITPPKNKKKRKNSEAGNKIFPKSFRSHLRVDSKTDEIKPKTLEN